MRLNHTRGASMGLITDASLLSSPDISWNHYGDRRVEVTGQDAGHWRTAPDAWDQDPKRHKSQGGILPAREPSGSGQLDWT
jgi:hypothetical protein